jgi:hypothetical protein
VNSKPKAKQLERYEYLREFKAKSKTARKVVKWIYEEPISAKTPENPPHCHVPFMETRKTSS